MFDIYIYNLGNYNTIYTTVTNLDELEEEIFKATNHGMNDYEIGILDHPYDFKVNDLNTLFKISEEHKTRIEDVGALLHCFTADEVIEILEHGKLYTIIESNSKVDAFEEYINEYDLVEIPMHLENYIDYEQMLIDWEHNGLLVEYIGNGQCLLADKW
ncbi:hypothetical protein [Clostridium sp. UBA4548]|uniref:hypothetical protein n=1 Tax=Clostridium sp. UBA4548 TaxID=1946361 RepID=UPI0025C6D0EB|nr:hypothetical protein [Clostridium sp. UBA4548]